MVQVDTPSGHCTACKGKGFYMVTQSSTSLVVPWKLKVKCWHSDLAAPGKQEKGK